MRFLLPQTVLLIGLLAFVPQADAQTRGESSETCVGTTDTGAFVGLIVEGEDMALFVTDGTPERVTVAEWITGREAKKLIQLERTEGRIRGTLSSGSPRSWTSFECGPTSATSGIFQTQGRDGSTRTWIQLDDGSLRGATFDSRGRPSPVRTRPNASHRISTLLEFAQSGGDPNI